MDRGAERRHDGWTTWVIVGVLVINSVTQLANIEWFENKVDKQRSAMTSVL